MRKMGLFAIAAALILIGIGTWNVSTAHANVSATDPFGLTASTKDLPTTHHDDFYLVLN